MKNFFKEFILFIKKGNIFDLAIGIIIGTGFNAIVRSLVNDIIMPLIGLLGGKNVQDSRLVLVPAVLNETGAEIVPAVTLNYGSFLQTIIDFFIIALSIFIAVRTIKSIRKALEKKNEEKNEKPKFTKTEELLMEIKEILKEKQNH